MLSAIPNFIGTILVASAKSVSMLVLSRFLNGLACGCIVTVIPIYLGEISSNGIRGSISSITMFSLRTGILFVYIVGHYVSISVFGFISMIIPIIFVLLFIWCPETPYHLLAKKKIDTADKCLKQLRGHSNVEEELKQMSATIELSQKNRASFRELFSAQNRQSLLISMALGLVCRINGSQIILMYAELIFDKIGSKFSAGYTTILFGAILLVASICAIIVMDKFGRRQIMYVSTITSIVCNTLLAIYFYLQKFYDLNQWTWLAVLIIMIFSIISVFGNTLPIVMLGEMFPRNLKGIGSILQVIVPGIGAFLFAKFFLIIVYSYGYDVMFGIYAIICIITTPYFWYQLPETKGKSFQVILDELHARSIKR